MYPAGESPASPDAGASGGGRAYLEPGAVPEAVLLSSFPGPEKDSARLETTAVGAVVCVSGCELHGVTAHGGVLSIEGHIGLETLRGIVRDAGAYIAAAEEVEDAERALAFAVERIRAGHPEEVPS